MSLQQRGCPCLGPAFPSSSPYPEGCCLLHAGSRRMHSPTSGSGSGPWVLPSHSQSDHYKDAETDNVQDRASGSQTTFSQSVKLSEEKVPKCWIPPGSVVPLLLTSRHLGERRGRRGVPGTGPAAVRRGHVPPECGECEWHA